MNRNIANRLSSALGMIFTAIFVMLSIYAIWDFSTLLGQILLTNVWIIAILLLIFNKTK